MKTLAPPLPVTSRLASQLRIGVSVACLLAALILSPGCVAPKSSLDAIAKAHTSTVQTVDSAMQSYATAVALGVVKQSDQDQVRKLYGDYQAAERAQEAAIVGALKTGNRLDLATTTAALTAAREPLLAALARFTKAP